MSFPILSFKFFKLSIDGVNDEFLTPKIDSTIKIVATQTMSASILPKLFSLLYEKNPKVSLALKTENQEFLLYTILKNELNGAFIPDDIASSKTKKVFAFKEKLALVSSTRIVAINDLPV